MHKFSSWTKLIPLETNSKTQKFSLVIRKTIMKIIRIVSLLFVYIFLQNEN